jgi:hypothetical protein
VCPDVPRTPDGRGCIPERCAPDLCAPDDNCRFASTASSAYYFCDTPRTWVGARDRCESRSYLQLASIEDSDEDDFLFYEVWMDKNWISGNDRDEEGTFVWATGQVFFRGDEEDGRPVDGAYTNFDPSEPNNTGLGIGGQPDCLILWSENDNWADANCNDPHPFVCEVVHVEP